jgi:metacaspase-1
VPTLEHYNFFVLEGEMNMKRFLLSLTVIALLSLTLLPPAILAKSQAPGQITASNIEIVKKITLKGPQAKGGKTIPASATGILGEQCTGSRYAVVIGINDYPGTSSDLQYAVNDANEMKSVLEGTYNFKNVNLLINSDATRSKIYDAINAIKSVADANAEVVFFFSGHGAKGKADDGDKNSVDQSIVVQENGEFAFIWDGELVQWFSGFQTNRIIFIFDSCLSGGMYVLKAPGRVVCMGSTTNGYSLEGASWGGGHGQFTYYFAEEGIEDGLADVRSHDEQVSIEEAYDYASANCKSQTPTIADGFTNDLLP